MPGVMLRTAVHNGNEGRKAEKWEKKVRGIIKLAI